MTGAPEPSRKAEPATIYDRKKVVSWALYDWANSAYATTVLAGFFPLFFKSYWSDGAPVTSSTFNLGAANSIASLVIVALAPILGAIADRGSAKKKFLFFFAVQGVVMTGSMSLVAAGNWPMAMALFVLATIGFSGSNIFYDALLVGVAPRDKIDFVSALGFSLGYLGGGLLFAVNVLMTVRPTWFGLSGPQQAVQISFVTVSVWWAVFSIPILLFVPEPKLPNPQRGWAAVAGGFRQLAKTFAEVRKLRTVFLFLIGYWLYIDGVDTIVRMAVDYGLSLGFQQNTLILALLITQGVGVPAAIAFGKVGERYGPKTGIFICLAVYLLLTVWATQLTEAREFYLLAIGVGLVQGGVQSLSRSYYSRLIPADKAGEFYGFYNMLGKFAAVIGPVLVGTVGLLTGSPRLSILSIAILFVGGAALLYFVDEKEGSRAARALEKI